MPPRYDGMADQTPFLLAYEEAVLEAGGDDKIMANWFPMALAGEPRGWPFNLPGSTVASWGNSVTSSLLTKRCRRTARSQPC